MGYDTAWAHIIPINLCQSPDMFTKKIAYLLSGLLVKSEDKLALLMNNTIVKDIMSDNVYVIMIVLSSLRYFLTADLLEVILPTLKKLLMHKLATIRKKTLLVMQLIK